MSQDQIVVEPAIAAALEQMKGAAKTDNAPAPKPLEFKVEDESVDPKYRGKTVGDIIKMHENAESRLGTMGQEVGTWRSLVAEMSTKIAPTTTTVKETAPKITSDELLTDPASAISQVVRHELEAALRPVHQRQDLSVRESELQTLNRDFPNMSQIGSDPEFRAWVGGARGRSADANAAAQGDTAAARRLLESWTDRQAFAGTKGVTKTDEGNGKAAGLEGARAAATESGGEGGRQQASGKIFHKAEVVELIIKNPDLYSSDAYQAELMLAAKEGRLR